MLTASFVITALAITVILGSALTAWLWLVRRKRLIVHGGLDTLAAMRWREFSRFVIEALQAQGFEASTIGPGMRQGMPNDLTLKRNGEIWLLSCKQGADSRVGAATVAELAKAVRITSSSGGILATLGKFEPEARKHGDMLELLDGAALWPLIDPLLPPSLHADLTASARARTIRATGLAWLVALAVGVALATLTSMVGKPSTESAITIPGSDTHTTPTAPAIGAPAEPPRTAPNPRDEQQQREQQQRDAVVEAVSTLPGVVRASWATRSTLLINLQGNLQDNPQNQADDRLVDQICAVLTRHDHLAASRVQLQPPADSGRPVRFTQCRLY